MYVGVTGKADVTTAEDSASLPLPSPDSYVVEIVTILPGPVSVLLLRSLAVLPDLEELDSEALYFRGRESKRGSDYVSRTYLSITRLFFGADSETLDGVAPYVCYGLIREIVTRLVGLVCAIPLLWFEVLSGL